MGKVCHDHDNELATLVIGLGDVTLINVKGENYGEMRDILQIAVHAFLRMKLVSYDHQRCLFIHQNVSAATAKDKLKYGCQKSQDYLDEMTAEAAKSEGKVAIKIFNRVIKFDCREDVFFFPDFWQGDPPMAHANPRYSQEVAKVRRKIFSDIATSRNGYLNFDHLWTRMDDLWAAIQTDDFVFSFKNTLEVKAYTNFEKKCKKVVPEKIQQMFQNWVAHQSKIPIQNCKNLKEIKEYRDLVEKGELDQLVEKIKNNTNTLITDIIHEDNYSSIIAEKWETEFIKDMNYKIDAQNLQMWVEINVLISKREAEILSGANSDALVASSLCDDSYESLADIDVDIDMYDAHLQRQQSCRDIATQIEETINTGVGRSCSKFVNDELKSQGISNTYESPLSEITQLTVLPEHISLDENHTSETDTDLCIRKAQKILHQFLFNAQNYLGNLERAPIFPVTHIEYLLKIAMKLEDEQIQVDEGMSFTFTKMYLAKVIVHVCRYACPILHRMQEKYFLGQRTQAEICHKAKVKYFDNKKAQDSDETCVVSFVGDILKQSLNEILMRKFPGRLKTRLKSLWRNKDELLREILTYLAEQLKFLEFKEFFKCTLNYAIQWVHHVKIKTMEKTDSTEMSGIAYLAYEILSNLIGEINKRNERTQRQVYTWRSPIIILGKHLPPSHVRCGSNSPTNITSHCT